MEWGIYTLGQLQQYYLVEIIREVERRVDDSNLYLVIADTENDEIMRGIFEHGNMIQILR